MSDDERKPSSSPVARARSESSGPDDVEPVKRKSKNKKRPRAIDPDEEDEGAEEEAKDEDGDGEEDDDDEDGADGGRNGGGDDEDEEEEDEDDDEDGGEDRRSHKRRKKQKNRNRFLDIEAEVDDEDEDEADDDDFADVAEFIDEVPEDGLAQDDHAHRRLDRRLVQQEQQESVEETVARLKERYANRGSAKYNPDSDHIPQRLLLPGVNDPSLFQVKVKTGQEKELIRKIFNKVEQSQYSGQPLEIFSAFSRDVLPGVILLESFTQAAVHQTVNGLVGVFMSQPPKLVPIEEMSAMLRIKKLEEIKYAPFQWVRLTRGKYAGDLAQVKDLSTLTDGELTLRILPRIDLTPRESRNKDKAGKTLGGSIRPPARLFDPDEVRKVYGRGAIKVHSEIEHEYEFDGDDYEGGFLIKDIKLSLIQAKDVKPTLEEVTRFAGDDAGAAELDLLAIQEANNTATADFTIGDKVEVSNGELAGLVGRVSAVTPTVITIRQDTDGTLGSLVEVATADVRKRFDVGEHVKVLRGKNRDASGMVVDVKGEVVTIMSDQGEQEIKAFSKDVRKAADAAGSEQTRGIYDLHDMVMLDSTTAAVIVKVEGAMLRIIDQNGLVKVVSPQEVTPRRDNKNYAVATDGHGNDMRVGDAMKETAGEGRTGEVINIFRSIFVFLFNRDISDNYGVFVARHSAIISVTPKAASGNNDLSKLNPMLQNQLPGGGAALMPPPQMMPNKSRLVNELVVVVKGTHKGLMGIIKDVQGEKARVEMATNNKVHTMDLSFLKRKDPKTGLTTPLDTGRPGMGGYAAPPGGGYDMGGYGGPMNGGATPSPYGNGAMGNPYAAGKTPNPYAAGGRTPAPNAWAAGGKTPAPGAWASGGKTPAPGAWASGGKTPAPGAWAAGGKTPAPGWAGGRTPAPGGGGFDGGRTPGWAGSGMGGGKTPNPYAGAGGRTPAPQASAYGQMSSSALSAPSPYGGPPTAPPAAAPTPGAYSAPTPYGGAPTPYSGPAAYSAPTPGAALSAPTPGAALGGGAGGPSFGAPTPYGGAAPTPYAGGPSASTGGPAAVSDLPWDWALDFRNVIVEIGPSTKAGSKVRHYVRGQYDGQQFGYSEPHSTVAGSESCKCTLLSDESVVENIPAEYIRPLRPTGPGQVVVVIQGEHGAGQQFTTDYQDDAAWVMQIQPGEAVPTLIFGKDLCRIWRA